jgi:adenylate/guanylate cyclase family protein
MACTETVTVVFTDLVGSTELASRLGHDAYELLRRSRFEALRLAVANHNGSEVKTTGDGLMLRFSSTADAVDCAIAMQQSADICSRQDNAAPLEIRIAVSSGEATNAGGDLYGPPVVEAPLLCAAASAGQISRLTKELLPIVGELILHRTQTNFDTKDLQQPRRFPSERSSGDTGGSDPPRSANQSARNAFISRQGSGACRFVVHSRKRTPDLNRDSPDVTSCADCGGHRAIDLRAPGVMINLPHARLAKSEKAASGESRN